jgi:hypothetical protein
MNTILTGFLIAIGCAAGLLVLTVLIVLIARTAFWITERIWPNG